jgi:pectate lyase
MAITPKTANGWGGVYNGGITGGAGGVEVSFSDFPSMWVWMDANKTLSAIVTYTGSDFNRIGFDAVSPNSTFSNSSRFEIQGLKNKTIRASIGQKLTMVTVRFRDFCENVIWENWNMLDAVQGNDLLSVLNDSVNVWIRHCTLDANQFSTDGIGVDGAIDIAVRCNYVAVTDCIIRNVNKTCLISNSEISFDDSGLLKTTYARNLFFKCIQRKPLVRFGWIGMQHNIFDFADQAGFGSSKAIDVSVEAQVWSYRNKFINERYAYYDRETILALDPKTGGIKTFEDVFVNTGGTTGFRDTNVGWEITTEPNYTLDDWTQAQAEEWIYEWAGATMHLMTLEPEDEFSLTVTTTTGGTVSQSPLGANFTAGTSITLTATASEGFIFSRYRNPTTNETLSTNAVYTFSKSASAQSIQAVFVSDIVIPPNQKRFIARKRNNPIV